MNPLSRILIEKAGNDHGFEYVLPSEESAVNLASARHSAQVRITLRSGQFVLVLISPTTGLLKDELARSFPSVPRVSEEFMATDQDTLTQLLRRAAELAHALPTQAAQDYCAILEQELERLPAELKGTEVERMVRQRVGQEAFRNALLDYWGGACAVTGIALTEVLRASHAKPWAECASDAERLDVFNGFLLSANLDALFDRFLISFSDAGRLLVSPIITPEAKALLGLDQSLQLRWLAPQHRPYLKYHQERLAG